jgi:hypothetical protein
VTLPFAMATSTFVPLELGDVLADADAEVVPVVVLTGADPDPPEPLSSPDPQPAITKTASPAATTKTERGTRISEILSDLRAHTTRPRSQSARMSI